MSDHERLEPGQPCPTCERRLPYPKTPASPKDTRNLNVGVGPADTVTRLLERLDDFAETAGLSSHKYARIKAFDLLLILGAAVEKGTLEQMVEDLPWAA